MKNKLLLLFLPIFIVFTTVAQQKQISKPDGKLLHATTIDGIVKKLMDTAEVTGLCLGIVNDNTVSYVKSYGYKNKAKNEWNDTSTCFYAASLAKPLFAYLVMQLVDKVVIDLDKPLYTYLSKPLPEYKNYKDLMEDNRWKLITARHCLDHTTGFPNWRQLNPHNNQKLEIFFTPGERYAYSGEGLRLLQMVVETVTGRQLEDLAQEYIFKPFGMVRSSFLWQLSFETNYAVGHDMNEDTLPKNKRTKANAAGSMETTIADWTRFVEAVMQGKGLSQKAKQDMLSPQIGIYTKHQFPSLNNDTTSENKNIQLSYGLGWGLFKSPYGLAFFKEGHDDGWEHYCINFPDKRTSVIIMTNSSNGESIFKELVEEIAGVTIPWEWEGYTPYQPTVKLPWSTLSTYVGIYSLLTDPKKVIIIAKEKDHLVAKVSEQETLQLVFQSDTIFRFKNIGDAKCEFIKENGIVLKFIVDQNGIFEWIRTQ
jgi:CubicO group peptidase (beta-lactamase class C family)